MARGVKLEGTTRRVVVKLQDETMLHFVAPEKNVARWLEAAEYVGLNLSGYVRYFLGLEARERLGYKVLIDKDTFAKAAAEDELDISEWAREVLDATSEELLRYK